MKTITKTLIAASLIGMVSLPSVATKYRHYDDYNREAIDYAKVIDSQPVYETYEVNKPVENCWNERVSRHSNHDNRNNSSRNQNSYTTYTPEILGAVIGAAVGNKVGSKSSERKAATIIGAVLGTTIGRDVKNKRETNSPSHRHENDRYDDRHASNDYDTVRRCEMRDSYTTEQHIVGYDVEYKYLGNTFQARVDERPGRTIKVKVSVNPV